MDSRVFKIGFYVIAAIIVMYFAFSTFPSFFTDDITGQVIDIVSYDEYVTVEGFVLRDEVLLVSNKDFVSISYSVENGDRVGKNSVYAVCSSDSLDSESKREAVRLGRKISELEDSLGKNNRYNIVTTEDNIKNRILKALNGSDGMDFTSMPDLYSEVQIALNRRQMLFDGTSVFESELAEYTRRLRTLSSGSGRDTQLYAPIAGYFYSGFDGYEYLRSSDYVDLTVSDYYRLASKPASEIPANYVGKMQSEPNWKFCALMDSSSATLLSVGKKVNLEFDIDLVGSKKILANVDYISKSEDGKTAVTFSCNTMFGDLFTLRKEKCRMVINTYTGFQVDTAAIRVKDGEQGVYVLSGQRVIFKPVNLLYSTENISIIETKSNSGSRVLMSKDTVVIGGKDLFDGKVVNVSN